MKKQQIIILISSLFVLSISTRVMAQKRIESPVQIQLNFAGAFIHAFGQGLSDSEVTSFEVEDWLLPGIDIGYYLNKRIYLGYAFTPSRTQVLKEPWGLSNLARDANIAVRYESGSYHNLNFRYFPFRGGLYLGASLVSTSKADYNMSVERTNAELRIGNGSYDTDASASWNFKKAVTMGISLGYTHVFNNSVSLGFGLVVPMISGPYYEDIQLDLSNTSITNAGSDINLAVEKLRDETFFLPVQFNIHLGYSLNFFQNR